MGKRRKAGNAVRNTRANKAASVKQGSVQEMSDTTYMYMLIIGQLMYDRKHLIAEKLAANLSLADSSLASSDALLTIIKKSRGLQSSSAPQIKDSITTSYAVPTLKYKPSISSKTDKINSDVPKQKNENTVIELDTETKIELSLADSTKANEDSDVLEDSEDIEGNTVAECDDNMEQNDSVNNRSEENTDDQFNSRPTSFEDGPRQTADGKIIMVYVPQEKFPCPMQNCKQNFLSKRNLDYHLVCSRIHNPKYTKDWGCRYCGREFSNMSQVKHHEKMKHEDHDKEVCYECGKQFESLDKMKRHIDVHHLQKKYKCKQDGCPMEFSSESGAKYHYKRVHLNEQISCTFEGCPRKFDRNCDLRRHFEKVHRDGQLGSTTSRTRKQEQQQQPLHPVQHHVQPELQHEQPMLQPQYQQEDNTYQTGQSLVSQINIPTTVIPPATLDAQQLNPEQLQTIQSLHFLQQHHHQQQQQQQQQQSDSQFPVTHNPNFPGYMF